MNTAIESRIVGYGDIADFFGKGNRLWFGDLIHPDNTVVFSGDTKSDFLKAVGEAIERGACSPDELGRFYVIPILDEFWWCGGEEGDIQLCSFDSEDEIASLF
ncbi:hypothetical protein IMCC3088_317 [Aequoribacter fuscus]|jgi:hypothetical protein|uniref:Uncharacterized protein n=1 Tax=Aequoribacter fuscus TaxID=2518989 RepID=F3L5N7_9GAMM|nr:hypothetical protein [Aequoribacter fuscus]EGG28362.1 hypothetical protein IMCC3088_317 [Aequoribacter fuscus]QHJ87242.1 hypothetical protein EYZ66_02540 [Aequoribacter fuscus]